jgi:YccS/YhfK family integral membrane protein
MWDDWRQFWQHGWKQDAFSRGLRSLVALASVTLGGWWLDQTQAVIPLLLGVIAGALAETDDSWRGQLKAQLITLLCFAAMALAIKTSLPYPAWMMAVLGASAFGLTLLGALGERYRAMAFATLILAIYTALATQPQQGHATAPWSVSLLLAGAAWYGLIAVLWAAALPMLVVRQKMAALYEVLGVYLQLKSRLLEPVRGIDLESRRLSLALHNGRVVEALNAVKESIFIRLGAGPAPAWLREALQIYFVAQDVHERVSSSHDQYNVLANAFFHSDALYRCQRVLELLGQDCLTLAQVIQQGGGMPQDGVTARAIEDLAASVRHIDALAPNAQDPAQASGPLRSLRALASNLSDLAQVLGTALDPLNGHLPTDASLLDRNPRSVAEGWQRLRAQWHLSSALMRHALRMSLALMVGYGVMLATGDQYGFWILLTIVFVCQPKYGATLKRLAQRISGTVLGLVVGWALLRLFPDVLAQSVFTVVAGVVFFATRQSQYTLATAAITSLVLLSFNQVGDGFGLIVPRLYDTLIGSLIAGLAVWLVLPSWQSRQLHRVAAQTLRAQAGYLREIMAQYRTGKQDHLAYRLARRDAHNADAALSGALTAVFQEPFYVRRNAGAGTRFLVLSHTMLSYLSALGAHRNAKHLVPPDAASQQAASSLLSTLDALANALDRRRALPPPVLPAGQGDAQNTKVLQAQLRLCLQLLPELCEQAAALVSRAPTVHQRSASEVL